MRARVTAHLPTGRVISTVLDDNEETIMDFVQSLKSEELASVTLNPEDGYSFILPAGVAKDTTFEIRVLEGSDE